MKPLVCFLLLLALSGPAVSGGRRRAAASPAVRSELSVSFVAVSGTGSDAVVDTGAVSAARDGRERAGLVRRKTFGVRIDGPAGLSEGTATLRAFLESHDGRSTIRIDGIELGSVPKVIDVQAPFGVVREHTLEIEVPATVAEGTFASSVRWEVSTNWEH
jgi:hypothetical protein